MSAAEPQMPDRPRPTVFLSYASEDRAAVQRIRDALPHFGLEAWYDESDLLGGDAWDQKIRRQIHDCDFFMPVISAHTEVRREGYFRREWRLAAERTLDMADDSVFLVPVVIDGTGETHARVPDKFRAVQWVRLPDGQPNAALEALCRRLVSGEPQALPTRSPAKPSGAKAGPAAPRGNFPAFPREEPGQRARFWAHVLGWMFQCAWVAFGRLPKWVRVLAYLWIGVLILQRSCAPSHHAREISAAHLHHLAQLAQIAQSLRNKPGGASTAAAAGVLAPAARAGPAAAEDASTVRASLLMIPFTVPPGDAIARKFAGEVYGRVYGRLLLMPQEHIALSTMPLTSRGSAGALEQGRAQHSSYVLYGDVSGPSRDLTLAVRIIATAGGASLWSGSYPIGGADPAHVAAQVTSEVLRIGDEGATQHGIGKRADPGRG